VNLALVKSASTEEGREEHRVRREILGKLLTGFEADRASLTVSGTLQDVMTFFQVGERTMTDWNGRRLIPFFRCGRNLMYGEEGVTDHYAKYFLAGRRLEPGEAKEIARREWRAHLALRRAGFTGGNGGNGE